MSEKTNVTLKLDADLVREARVLAAHDGTSLSRMLAARLEDLVRQNKAYASAKRRALSRLQRAPDLGWKRPASRSELHER